MSSTPIYDQLVAERGDPTQFGAYDSADWLPWRYAVDRVYDLSQAPVIRAAPGRKSRTRKRSRNPVDR